MATATALALACLSPALAAPASGLGSCPTVTADGSVVPWIAPGTGWSGCDLRGANLDGANLTGSFLIRTDLRGASLRGALLRDAYLASARLDGADLTGADLTRAELISANLTGATASGAILTGATLRSAVVTSSQLSGADLRGLVGESTVGVPASVPAGWGIHGGWLVGPGVDLTEGNLDGLDLSGSDLDGASLSGATAHGTSFAHASFAGAILNGTSFVGANLTGATGLTTARTNAVTSWGASRCPDGLVAEKHDGRSCLRALDSVAPAVAVIVPAFTIETLTFMTAAITERGSGIDAYRERIYTAPTATTRYGRAVVSPWISQYPRPYATFTGDGLRTCVQLQVRDHAGHVSAWSALRCTDGVIDDTAAAWSLAGRWRFQVADGWIQASSQSTSTHGDWMESTSSYSIRRLGVVALACPTCGSVALYVGGRKVGAFSLAAATTGRRTFLLPRWATPKHGYIRMVITSPNGRVVKVDGMVVSSL